MTDAAWLLVTYVACGVTVAFDYRRLDGVRPSPAERVFAGLIWPRIWWRTAMYYWGPK